MNLLFFLFLGYSVVWVAVLAYVASLGLRQARLEDEVRLLQASLRRR